MGSLLILGGSFAVAGGLGDTLFGFGTAGMAAGSLASAMQGGFGNVAAGSTFATLTSLGMTGAFTTTAAGGGITAALGALIALL